jgi:non-specific serine/threonine protein kinase/serine/threonine-protein kinase
MPATPDNWSRVKELFDAALDQDPARRPAFLEESCSDAQVRAEVERLLAEHEEAGKFLSVPAIGETADEVLASKRKIDSYYLLQLIGEGGMGEVWLAEQKEPVRRRVAIKLIKAGMDTREVVARFESERQALALMDHPAIAKVFDAGSTSEGRPYFVMEYVAGTPITTYCDRHKLTTRQRLELFIQVCEGVQHAHQKAIIHRDLKPSNILVSEVDGKPMPRIIDFGLAKATSRRLTDASIYTRVGAMLGTIDYMSPEQADSGGEDIDTRTDVYSLGVVLYQLLAGALPLDLKKLAYEDMLRRLREQDVPRPSSRILTQGGDSAMTAQNRGTDPPSLMRQLRGDPDVVVLKALEKDRKRRYGSPSQLAEDIGRYLRNEPVSAHAPSAGYRARKYIRRHRLGVAIAAAAVLLLAGSAINAEIQSKRIARERDRADQNLELAEKNLKLAETAVDESLSSASAQPSQEAAESPETEELRRQLQEKAQTFYSAFLKAAPDSEDAVKNMAMAHLRLADIDRLRSMNQDAVNEYTLAIAQLTKLSTEHPTNPDYRQQLGYCHNWIGETLRLWLKSQQKPAQYTVANAQNEYNQAIAMQQDLHQNAPTIRDYQQDLARSYYNRGILQFEQTQADPEPDYQRAAELLKPLVGAGHTTQDQAATSPEPSPEQELARVDNNIGLDLDQKHYLFEQAVQSIGQATQIADQLLRKYPANHEYKMEAATYYNNLALEFGNVYCSEDPRKASNLEQAKKASLRAQQLAGDLARSSPGLQDLSNKIAKIRGWLDDTLSRE